jgi:hypothetical protein
MKRLVCVPLLALLLGCNGDSAILQPDDSASVEVLAAAMPSAVTVPFTAISAFSYPINLPIDRITGPVTHRTGSEYVWTVTGDVEGLFTATGTWLYDADGNGTGHGGWTMALTHPCTGTMTGEWHGVMDPDFAGSMVGQGKDGCKGITMKADFRPVTPGNNFVLNSFGRLHYAGGPAR